MQSKIKLFILCIFLTFPFLSFANNTKEHEQKIIHHFIQQANLFPQEKIHLHIDRTSYVTGEKVWLKAYLVNSLSHEPMTLSKYVYVELINPNNVVVRRVKIREQEGQYHGYIELPESLPTGYYSLRAYTNFMYNLGEDYFYRSGIDIQNPQTWKYTVEPEFVYKNVNEVEARLHIRLPEDEKNELKNFDIRFQNQQITNLKFINDSTVTCTIRQGQNVSENTLYVAYEDFRKYVYIPFPENDFDVSFYPEGGNLVADVECKVAFKCLKSNGSPLFAKGYIKDEEGNVLATTETLHQGMGTFTLRAEPEKIYTAYFETENGISKTVHLPIANKNTESLRIEYKNHLISLSVNGTLEGKERYILAHTRGYPLYFEKYDMETGQINFARDGGFPAGVVHVLLLDDNYNVLSERLLFSKGNEEVNSTVKLNKKIYRKREKVKLDVDIASTNSFEYADLSLSVVDNAYRDTSTSHSIFSTLLLTSDLRGYIDNPDYYFAENTSGTEDALDLLMMVHGWRRYDVPQVLKGNFKEPTEPLEVGQEIAGKVRSLVRKKAVENSEVSIISTERSFFSQAVTNQDGEFFLQNFELPDSTEFVVQALNANGKQNVELILYEAEYPPIDLSIMPDISQIQYFDKLKDKVNNELYTMAGIRIIDLEEVAVRAKKVEFQKGYMSDFADNSFTLKDIEEIDATCLHELFRRIPGVEMRDENLYIRARTSIYGDNKAAIYVDGVYMDEGFDLHMIQMPDVARVDIFKTGSTSIFGSKGGSGVLSITTKNGNYISVNNPQFNIKRFTPLGYQTPVEFYSPKNDTNNRRKDSKLDTRTTIFWKPDLKTDSTGKVSCEFYTADFPTTYNVLVEGITSEGELVRTVEKIVVE